MSKELHPIIPTSGEGNCAVVSFFGNFWPFEEGFGHCSVFVQDNGAWVHFDSSRGRPRIEIYKEFETIDLLIKGLREVKIVALPCKMTGKRFYSPFVLGSCVELVKRVVGIKAPFVLTPYQLYSYIRKNGLTV